MHAVQIKVEDFLKSQPDWKRCNLEKFRTLVKEVEPEIEEGWKWSVPVYSVNGKLVCAMSTFKDHTKYNFFNGATLDDNDGLFNSGLDSKKHRSINLKQNESIDSDNLKALVKRAVDQVK